MGITVWKLQLQAGQHCSVLEGKPMAEYQAVAALSRRALPAQGGVHVLACPAAL